MNYLLIISLISFVIFPSIYFSKSGDININESFNKTDSLKNEDYCERNYDEEHTFDQLMIDYVGKEKFYQWFDSIEEHERTRTAFKKYFNISDEELRTILERKTFSEEFEHDKEHSFDLLLIEYVGEDRFYQWFESLEEDERTLTAFKKYFNISDEDLESIIGQKK
ncbi:hypothetical protein [Paenibacillus ginsengihumi]|uniref:hypothetical protein n=1 Tax=Paenibacillus ginsengihumi TaxID=431596 RepID=UPI0004763059|nr:hypothetical protein [Paenibacillus ginsengihumi]